MRYGTENLRQLWAPWRCNGGRFVTISSQGRKFYVADAAREAFEAAHIVAQAHGYPLRAGQCGSFNCRKIRNGKGWSLHAYGIAEDWNTATNPLRSRSKVAGRKTITDMPPGMVADVKAIRAKKTGELIFRWGGDYKRITDAMHWEIVVSPDDLSNGIDWTSVAGADGKVTKTNEEPSIVSVGRDNPLKQPSLRRGAKGPSVKKLQQELNNAGATLDDDGIFGKITEQAVRSYQSDRKPRGRRNRRSRDVDGTAHRSTRGQRRHVAGRRAVDEAVGEWQHDQGPERGGLVLRRRTNARQRLGREHQDTPGSQRRRPHDPPRRGTGPSEVSVLITFGV